MPVTQVSICNSALAKVGQSPIQSLSQDTRAAQLLNGIFDQIQDEFLAQHPWNFAIKREQITANASVPVYEFDYTFDLPSDCLRVLDQEADDVDLEPKWVVEGRTILANDPTLNIRFIYRNVDFSAWNPAAAEAFAWRLAVSVAYALTQSSDREKACMQQYQAALSLARSVDASEGTLKSLIADDWALKRR